MNILIIGGGGREHALAWKVAQSPKTTQVFVAPGNAGTAREHKVKNVPIEASNISELLEFAKEQHIDMTIIGPEAPLAAGIVNTFADAGLPCIGPTKEAAEMESSKSASKDFMVRHGIPTARFASFDDVDAATAYIKQHPLPLVIKASGLASGKGVVIAEQLDTAIETAAAMLSGNAFGSAGHSIIIEEYLTGEEASFIALVDGDHILPLATSQDHKARNEGGTGPNTGGMGAYSPAAIVTPTLHQRIMEQFIQPTVSGLCSEGRPFRGFLYAGLMISDSGDINVLEFNCRLGDPETQPIMLRLQSDLVTLLEATLSGQLDQCTVQWDPRAALGVVLTAGGYPANYHKGDIISGAETSTKDCKIFHSGTAEKDHQLVTHGGRVLCATALGSNVQTAQKNAYTLVDQIHWDNMYYRRDIGHRAIAKETTAMS